jgi:hypothetical protein
VAPESSSVIRATVGSIERLDALAGGPREAARKRHALPAMIAERCDREVTRERIRRAIRQTLSAATIQRDAARGCSLV